MDKFDKLIKEAVEGYEAPYNPQAWANVSDQMGFDNVVKEAVEGYEAPYNPQAWANVSSQLGSNGNALKWIVGTAAVATIIAGTVYFMQDDEGQPTNPVVTVNTVDPTITETELVIDKPTTGDVATNDLDADGNVIVPDANEGGTVPVTVDHGTGNPTQTNGGSQAQNGNTNSGTNTGNNGQVDPIVSHGNPENPVDVPADVRYNAKFNSPVTVMCAGAEFVFTPEETDQNALYFWDFGDGDNSTSKVAKHAFKKPGSYEVNLVLKDTKTNKIVGTTSMGVVVNPLPASEFTWQESTDGIPSVTFISQTPDAASLAWNIQGLKTSSATQVEYTFRKKGNYTVELTTENEFGCRSTVQKTIEIEDDYNLYAGTAVSPNGDGEGDTFIPQALKVMDVQFTMVIYDKSGKRMYQTTNAYAPWDGTNMTDGSDAPGGVYVWTVTYKNAYGETEYYEGTVTVLR
jgi:gliding motility-associated-like protein